MKKHLKQNTRKHMQLGGGCSSYLSAKKRVKFDNKEYITSVGTFNLITELKEENAKNIETQTALEEQNAKNTRGYCY